MALTRQQMDNKIDEHFGFEARDDVEGVLATLAPDVEHDIVGWPTGPARRGAATAHAVSTRRFSPILPTARWNAGSASMARTSWWTSRSGAGRHPDAPSDLKAGDGSSNSACCM